MLLRSVMNHVRDQNWFAVGIDFLIVVVGVFIGIQVANWNEERRQRMTEQALLERLQVEVDALLDVQRAELDAHRARVAGMLSTHPVLFGQAPPRPLTLAECEAVAGSHVYRRPTDDLPVLDEIRESDRFDLIRDRAVSASLRAYVLLRERARGRYAQTNNELFRLYSRHPDVLWIERVPRESDYEGYWTFLSGEGYRWNPVCDVAAMRASRAFLSEYADNMGRNNSTIEMFEERITTLGAVQQALRSALSQGSEAH